MIDILILLLCILIASTLFAGSYYFAKQVITIQLNHDRLQEDYKHAMDHIGKQEEMIVQLQQQIEYMDNEVKMNGERGTRHRTWNPSDPLNSQTRTV